MGFPLLPVWLSGSTRLLGSLVCQRGSLALGRSITFYDLQCAKRPARYKFSPVLWIENNQKPAPPTKVIVRLGCSGTVASSPAIRWRDCAILQSCKFCCQVCLTSSPEHQHQLFKRLICAAKHVVPPEFVCCFPVVICSDSKPTRTI